MGRGNHSTKARHWEQIDKEKRYKIEGLLEAGQRKGKIAKLLGMSERTIQESRKEAGLQVRAEGTES